MPTNKFSKDFAPFTKKYVEEAHKASTAGLALDPNAVTHTHAGIGVADASIYGSSINSNKFTSTTTTSANPGGQGPVGQPGILMIPDNSVSKEIFDKATEIAAKSEERALQETERAREAEVKYVEAMEKNAALLERLAGLMEQNALYTEDNDRLLAENVELRETVTDAQNWHSKVQATKKIDPLEYTVTPTAVRELGDILSRKYKK